MKILDLAQINSNILNEANILNVKDPHDGHSLQKYLRYYARSIGSDVAKKMFTKKLQTLLMNDEKYHFAVRELPDDAPGWAQEALAKRDLFYFKANDNLNTTVEHLTHYIAKLEEDMKSNDGNKKAVATKEFAGFARAESLDLLERKSNEYFDRGPSTAASFEGTKEIYKSGGFTWMKLETADAFRNAGTTLNNCIGSHWTLAKTEDQGETIIVLADSKGALIVAARIKNKKNELQELKGKNNRAPIKQYMPPVAAMINKFNLSLSSGAHNDVIRTGYYFDDETHKLLTKPQAIKKLVAVDVLGEIAFGLKLVRPKPASDTKAARRIFSELYTNSAYTYSDGMKGDKIYEGRLDNGNPVISATISNGILLQLRTFFNERLHDESHLQEALDVSKKHDYVKTFLDELIKRDVIKDIDRDIQRHVFWVLKLEWDKDARELRDRPGGRHVHPDKKDHKWVKHVDASSISAIDKTFPDGLRKVEYPIKKIFIATEEVADDRSRNEHDVHLAIVVDASNDAHLVNISGMGMSEKDVGYKKEVSHSRWSSTFTRVAPDEKTIRSIISLAKSEGFNLRTPAMARFGITGKDPENYKRFKAEWKKIPGDPEAIKADFSHLRDEDRFTAVYGTAMTELGGAKSQDLFHLNKKLAGDTWRQDNNINSAQQFDKHDGASANKAIGNIDAIYKVNIGYGTVAAQHGALVMVSNKKITKLDTATEKHKWQGWDDFDEVAEILTKFAKDHKLVYAKDAVTTDSTTSTEFRVDDAGMLTTATKQKTAELSRKKKKEGVDEITFADGWILSRMTPDEQSKWIRHGVGMGVRGQAWLLTDDRNMKRMVLAIVHQRVARMFVHMDKSGKAEWPTFSKTKYIPYMKYIKAASDQFNWKAANTGTMRDQRVSESTVLVLRTLASYPDPNNPGTMPPVTQQTMLALKSNGWVENISPRRYKVTEEGRDALRMYDEAKRSGGDVSELQLIKSADLHPDFKMPEKGAKKAVPKPSTGSQSKATGGDKKPKNKAEKALALFKKHVDDEGKIPTRGEFIAYMEEDPFNMSKAGAQTYYYTTKKKYANLNESILGSLAQLLLVEPDASFDSFANLVID